MVDWTLKDLQKFRTLGINYKPLSAKTLVLGYNFIVIISYQKRGTGHIKCIFTKISLLVRM